MADEELHNCECGEECCCDDMEPETFFLHALDLYLKFFPESVAKIAEITTKENNQEIVFFSPSGVRDSATSQANDAVPALISQIPKAGTYPVYYCNISKASMAIPDREDATDDDRRKAIAISIIDFCCSFPSFFIIDTRTTCKQSNTDRFKRDLKLLSKYTEDMMAGDDNAQEGIQNVLSQPFYSPVNLAYGDSKYRIGKDVYTAKELIEKMKEDEDFDAENDEEEQEEDQDGLTFVITNEDGLLSVATTENYLKFFEGAMGMKYKTYKKYISRLETSALQVLEDLQEKKATDEEDEEDFMSEPLTYVPDGINLKRDSISSESGEFCCFRMLDVASMFTFVALKELIKEKDSNEEVEVVYNPDGELFGIVGIVDEQDIYPDGEEMEEIGENEEDAPKQDDETKE